MPFPSRRRASASTLVMVMFTITILAVFIGLALDYTGSTGTLSRHARDYTAAQALANGSLDAAYKRWQVYMAANQAGTIGSYTTTAQFAAIASDLRTKVNAATGSTGYTLNALSIVSVDRTDSPIATGGGAGYVNGSGAQYGYLVGSNLVTSGSTGPMANVPGWIATTYNYRATAVVSKVNDPSMTLSISRFFQQADASLFQAMLFFQNDLELHPGPAMTLTGPVHTNANLYAVAGSGGSLTFASNVSYHGNQSTLKPAANYNTTYSNLNGYIEGVTATLYAQESGNWGSFNLPTYASSHNSQLANVQALYPLGTDDAGAIDASNPNASGTHEIIERPDPVSASNPSANTAVTDPDAFKAHRIWNSAGLRVLINRNDTVQPVRVYTPGSADGEASTEVVPNATTPNIANKIINAISVSAGTSAGDIYDFREGHGVNVDTIDMSALTPVLNTYGSYNGVVYVSDITHADAVGNTGNADAIRIKKGGVLPDNGLTLASDGAVYVQGDYNTGTTYGSDGSGGAITITKQPVANTAADPTQFTVAGYTQKPASIMGDAVMVLSNSWLDSNSSLAIAARNALPTTFNAAIVSGAVLTTNTAASGGAHNFPRFLENWGGDNFTYHGSMCELYASTHFTGTYGKSNVYSPPNRRWYFDTNFLTTPPPGNLRSTTYTRGRWIRNNNS